MTLSSMMGAQASQMHHTLNLSLLKSSLSTQAAQSIKMLEKMNEENGKVLKLPEAPHPVAGHNIDVKL